MSVLVITLSNKGGSWHSTKLLLDEIKKKNIDIIVCSGKPSYNIQDKNIRHIYMNKIDLYRIHSLFIIAPFISIFLFLPISICGLILSIIHKPRLVIVNGLIPLLLLILLRIFNRNTFIVLEYHGAIEERIPKLLAKILKIILNVIVDLAIVNSIGSYKDLSKILDSNRIIIREHIVDDSFFKKFNKKELRHIMNIDDDKFVIAYIGHLTYEKGFDIFLHVILRLLDKEDILFIIIGDGPLRKYIELLEKKCNNIRYYGYISERLSLQKYYVIADLVWSYADETYLARPAVEALASGTPIIIPDVPAVFIKRIKGKRISKALMPEDIGFIVDHTDIEGIIKLILSLKRKKDLLKNMGEKAYKYALKKYNSQHLKIMANFILKKSKLL